MTVNAHASGLKWKDVTRWSRSDTPEDRKTPRTWELDVCDDVGSRILTVVVTRHIHFPGTWMMASRGYLQIDTKDLHTDDAEGAKAIALKLVVSLVDVMAVKLAQAMGENS